jgi:hypothetical protein
MPAITADSVIVELEARTADYDKAITTSGRVMTKFGSDAAKGAAQAEGAVVGSLKRIETSSGNTNGSQLILQSVIRRTTDQFAAGAPLATIFAEHISAIAEAGELAGGAMGKFGALLQGPFGLALSATASITAILAQKFFETGDEAKKAVDPIKTLTDAIKDLTAASNADIQADDISIRKKADLVLQLTRQAIAEKTVALTKLQGLQAEITAQQHNHGLPGTSLTGEDPTAAADTKTEEAIQAQIARLNAALRTGADALRAAAASIVRGEVGASLDAATAATRRFTAAQRTLAKEYRDGKVSIDDYRTKETALEQAHNAELDALNQSTKGHRAHRQVISEEAKAAADYIETLRKLGSEEGLIGDLIRDNNELRSLPGADAEMKGITDPLAKSQKAGVDAVGAAIELQQRQQEEGIRTLSGLYYDLFTGGTKSLWKDFEQMGLAALAKIAAEKTFAALLNFGAQHSGDGGILGTLATAASSFGGPRAAGGPVAAGGTYLVGEKGPELLQMGASAGNIVPHQAAAMRPSGGQMTGGTVEHRIVIEPNEMFDTHVDTRVVGGIVQYAPVIIEGAKSATFAAANRPSLPRSAG